MKRKSVLMIMVGIIFLMSFNFSSATIDEGKSDSTEKHVQDLIDGKVKPVNEDKASNIKIITGEETSNNMNASRAVMSEANSSEKVKLVDQNTILDVVRTDNKDSEEYQATAILENTYEVPAENNTGIRSNGSETKRTTLVDVKFSCTMVYSKLPYKEDVVDLVKVTKYKGGYVKSNDLQMTCKSIAFLSRAFGHQYNDAGKYVKTGKKYTPKKTYNSPAKGSMKVYKTGQTTYFETGNTGYNQGRFYYTVKRNNSKYTKSSYMAFGFGTLNAF